MVLPRNARNRVFLLATDWGREGLAQRGLLDSGRMQARPRGIGREGVLGDHAATGEVKVEKVA